MATRTHEINHGEERAWKRAWTDQPVGYLEWKHQMPSIRRTTDNDKLGMGLGMFGGKMINLTNATNITNQETTMHTYAM